jgi:hypothetical protein
LLDWLECTICNESVRFTVRVFGFLPWFAILHLRQATPQKVAVWLSKKLRQPQTVPV